MSDQKNDLPFPGLNQVKHLLAISSCKGGVGKSTTAVNVAYALSAQGLSVGLLDADIYGPSLPTMVAPEQTELFQDQQTGLIEPLDVAGVKLMSFGYLNQEEAGNAAILRGPMVSNVITQLSTRVNWGALDVLVVDYPPGTGDIQLTLGQTLPFSGALIVTTPQHLSFIDVVKGIQMFDKLKVPTLGVVENMSYFTCPDCKSKHRIFGEGARQRLKSAYGFKNSFEVPMEPALCRAGDTGLPVVLENPKDPLSSIYLDIANKTYAEMVKLKESGTGFPNLLYNVGLNCELEYPDGRIVEIVPSDLRKACRCAACIDEMTGAPLLDPNSVPDDIFPQKVEPVGNYAVSIHWSDDHRSIYPYESLIKDFDSESPNE